MAGELTAFLDIVGEPEEEGIAHELDEEES